MIKSPPRPRQSARNALSAPWLPRLPQVVTPYHPKRHGTSALVPVFKAGLKKCLDLKFRRRLMRKIPLLTGNKAALAQEGPCLEGNSSGKMSPSLHFRRFAISSSVFKVTFCWASSSLWRDESESPSRFANWASVCSPRLLRRKFANWDWKRLVTRPRWGETSPTYGIFALLGLCFLENHPP